MYHEMSFPMIGLMRCC